MQGANTVELKRHFGWVQEGTALKYTDDTKKRARKMARLLTGPSSFVNAQNKESGDGTSKDAKLSIQDGGEGLAERKVYHINIPNSTNVTVQFQ